MKDHIWQRVVEIGNYILNNGATVRDTAKVFGVSKSTVHKDVTERLP
ncbi:MAG: sporulation transcriptional regulator SpoIIID, partial [Firmicutes bacterium]|nr:sporulation transcriptional regulator SpoIIID [Bacillota bacterium]